MQKISKLINLNGKLHDLSNPIVMGIVNVTPDSFFEGSRYVSEKKIAERAEQILSEGGSVIDLGAYSSRPNAEDISEEEEWNRLAFALHIVRKTAPEATISVDTFRSEIAKRAVGEFGVAMINDISGGEMDDKMFETICKLRVPYVLMHIKGTPQTMQQNCNYENMIQEIVLYFSRKVEALRKLGVCDIILDPGFGFSKTVDQNYELLHHLSDLCIFDLPVLVGLSRKSMIYKTLDITPEQCLNGTTVLNTLSVMGGADILRVHDVKEAVETIKLVTKTLKPC
jgi:dihydropteroate synthase